MKQKTELEDAFTALIENAGSILSCPGQMTKDGPEPIIDLWFKEISAYKFYLSTMLKALKEDGLANLQDTIGTNRLIDQNYKQFRELYAQYDSFEEKAPRKWTYSNDAFLNEYTSALAINRRAFNKELIDHVIKDQERWMEYHQKTKSGGAALIFAGRLANTKQIIEKYKKANHLGDDLLTEDHAPASASASAAAASSASAPFAAFFEPEPKPLPPYVIQDSKGNNYATSVEALDDGRFIIHGKNNINQLRSVTLYPDGTVSGYNGKKGIGNLGVVERQLFDNRSFIFDYFKKGVPPGLAGSNAAPSP